MISKKIDVRFYSSFFFLCRKVFSDKPSQLKSLWFVECFLQGESVVVVSETHGMNVLNIFSFHEKIQSIPGTTQNITLENGDNNWGIVRTEFDPVSKSANCSYHLGRLVELFLNTVER